MQLETELASVLDGAMRIHVDTPEQKEYYQSEQDDGTKEDPPAIVVPTAAVAVVVVAGVVVITPCHVVAILRMWSCSRGVC